MAENQNLLSANFMIFGFHLKWALQVVLHMMSLSAKFCQKSHVKKTSYLLKCQTWGNCENQNLLSAPENQNLLSAPEKLKPPIYTSNEKWDFYVIYTV